jgi:hypothetical protein
MAAKLNFIKTLTTKLNFTARISLQHREKMQTKDDNQEAGALCCSGQDTHHAH